MTGGFGLYSIRGSYLYLRAGDSAYAGLHIAENNYISREHKSLPGNENISGWDSFITAELQRGATYTIEVTTAGSGNNGQYKLHVRTR